MSFMISSSFNPHSTRALFAFVAMSFNESFLENETHVALIGGLTEGSVVCPLEFDPFLPHDAKRRAQLIKMTGREIFFIDSSQNHFRHLN
jgi:hypothetical protein